MKTVLVETLLESRGYLEDQGWHQTAQLMVLAADEIQRLAGRVHELENARGIASGDPLAAPQASNQNTALLAPISSRR